MMLVLTTMDEVSEQGQKLHFGRVHGGVVVVRRNPLPIQC